MAKPSSAHSDGPAPATITRRTRSQSAEPVEPVEVERPTTRGSRHSAQKAPSASAPVGRAKKRGRKPPQKAEPDLTTVDEDAELEDEDLPERQLQVQDEHDIEEMEEPRRVSAAISVISGTTAKTSFSQEEVQDMDPDIIIDSLPSLASAFDGLARVLLPAGKATPPSTWKDIRTQGTKIQKLHTNRLNSIKAHKENFGRQEYIQPRIVLKALFGVDESSASRGASWRPDDILLKINLIHMMNDLLVRTREPGARTTLHMDVLERLLTAFPASIAGQEYSNASVEMYANIATHVAIARLEASVDTDPNFSAHHIIDQLFFDEEGAFVHMTELGLASTTDTSRARSQRIIQDLMDALKAPFEDEDVVSATAAVGHLKSRFEWDALIDHALRYYENRSSQLTNRISRHGGVESILQGLTQEMERRQHAKEADRLRQKYSKPASTQRRSLGSMAKLKERERLMAGDDKAASSEATRPTHAATKPPVEVSVASEAETTIVEPTLPVPTPEPVSHGADSSARFAQAFNAQASRKIQRPRLLDPQPDATRVDTNFDLDSVASQRGRTPSEQPELQIPGSSRAGKRKRVEVDDEDDVPDPTQDEGFETDARDFAVADQRRREIQFAQVPGLQHRERSIGAPGPSNYAATARDEPSPSKRQRKNPGSIIPAPLPPLDPEADELPASTIYQRSKVEVKINRAASGQAKGPRQRQGWLEEEETALMELIAENGADGISWQFLKALDEGFEQPRLWRRTAEDLRFKARNMKVIMLKTGRGCPENWEHVSLGKKEIEQVRRAGVNYEQERQRAEPVRVIDE